MLEISLHSGILPPLLVLVEKLQFKLMRSKPVIPEISSVERFFGLGDFNIDTFTEFGIL